MLPCCYVAPCPFPCACPCTCPCPGSPIEPKNAANVDVPGFTRFFRDGNSSESTTTYSRSCVWMMVDFSGTSGLSRTQFEDLLSRVGREIGLRDTNYRRYIPAAERLSICLR
ncbi:hypothetical protein ATANTOWER_030961 [Ataeniobius toweri]|uniref:Uncharacterized protein n=1 Tax=Ataeniobius toweri TaxID=208326 RepID=A0ABU7AHM4_9TELE|nr:hypothetical protein [Ataeniobius toweri]